MDIQKKQATWNQERPLFELNFMHSHLLEYFSFNGSTGDYELVEVTPNFVARDVVYEVLNTGWAMWLRAKCNAKSQAVPEWISTSDRMPEEGEAVLFLDKNDTIHDGYLSTDYVDGPYGENGQDFGGDQTLWASNSNGEELLLNKVKYWMHRPSNPSASKSGAKS